MNEHLINEKYEPLFLSNNRYAFLTGGRASGKSTVLCIYVILEMMKKGNNILFCRYTMTSAEKSIIPEFLEMIEKLQLKSYFNITKTVITHKNGNKLYFSGIKTSSGLQTANLKSLKANIVVFDEFEEVPNLEIWQKINLSIRDKNRKNKIIMAMNSSNKLSWIYQYFFVNKLKNCDYIHSTFEDVKEHLSSSILDDFERLKGENYKEYEHQILGLWRDNAESIVYKDVELADFDTLKLSFPRIIGCDIGFTDPLALIDCFFDDLNRVIYVKELIFASGLTNDKFVKKVNKLVDERVFVKQKDIIVVDSAAPSSIMQLRENNFIAIPVKKPKIIERVRAMQNYKIVCHKDSKNIWKELQNYAFDTTKIDTPFDLNNHALDAIGYAFSYYKRLKA